MMTARLTVIEDTILGKLRTLPPEKQHEVLDFVEFMLQRGKPAQSRQSVNGLWKDLIDKPLTAEDIEESRREMPSDFPREDVAL